MLSSEALNTFEHSSSGSSMRAGSSFRVTSSSTSTTFEGSSSEGIRSLPVCLASLAGLFSGDVLEGFLVSFGVSESEVWVFASFEVDVATKGWLEESSGVSVVGAFRFDGR